MASAVTFAAVAYAIGLRDAPVSNPDLVRVLPEMAWMFLPLGAGSARILLVLASCIVSFQTAVLPRRLACLGIVVAIVLLFDVIYVMEGGSRPDTSPRGGSVPDFVEGIYVARKALRSASNMPRQSAHLSR
jgi:hypothetical protein